MLTRPTPVELPANALLQRHALPGNYWDAYALDLPLPDVRLADFVAAFYTTWLFKRERWVLGWLVRRPSTDQQALELARGDSDQFAAWTVADRDADQLLLGDLHGHTCSWFMVVPGRDHTRLLFGSAVIARTDPRDGSRALGWPVRALLGFHKLYSRLLLQAAARRLRSGVCQATAAGRSG